MLLTDCLDLVPHRCHLVIMKRVHLRLPYLARETALETLKLPASRKVDYMRCHDPVFDQVRGRRSSVKSINAS